mmetsp:Transcript_13385/g.19693  ORF Transcript_13385/g.19693 Transcript_13385/m.19693 type:complete len:260 (-) Transcript_13385:145-924(-)|eukprot:CAMPEP_0194037838 /NCGR_PEP_ID=MMETSP0009_2-20130614/10171_1 /TAXON_ID=210454 /ORGANISM="Grammatophora oceanica, Strain CCMP 410" /LENGTH=259 /DNA_ID=CAMNT_0038680163 /DNA_START=57 /DNA_END=836 /DNA_ORIENTATION=+
MADVQTAEQQSTDSTDSKDGWVTKSLQERPPPPPLPTGWIVRRCKSQPGTIFYYHQETGESQWEMPVVYTPPPRLTEEAQERQQEQLMPPASSKETNSLLAAPFSSNANKREAPSLQAQPQPALKKTKTSSSSGTSSSGSPKEVRALHILRKHRDSRRPASWREAKITKTKEEAIGELAEFQEILQESAEDPEELRATFEELARTESDCTSAKRGGDLGFFGRGKMQAPFEKASFALGVGDLSDIVETSSGVHLILRVG